MKELSTAAPVLNLSIEELRVPREATGFEDVFHIAVQKRVEAVIT
jgi:hypothetical protein